MIDVVDLGHQMQAMGVKRVVYTDVGRDGMSTASTSKPRHGSSEVSGLHVIASGGVAESDRYREAQGIVEHFNIEGVITGQAIYTGCLDLAEAIEHGPSSAGAVQRRHHSLSCIGENGLNF